MAAWVLGVGFLQGSPDEALLRALEGGHLGEARAAIERGARVDLQATDGTTALMLAGVHFDPKTAKWLLAKGASPHLQDK